MARKSEYVRFRLPADLAAQARNVAAQMDMSLSEFVRRAADDTLPDLPTVFSSSVGPDPIPDVAWEVSTVTES